MDLFTPDGWEINEPQNVINEVLGTRVNMSVSVSNDRNLYWKPISDGVSSSLSP